MRNYERVVQHKLRKINDLIMRTCTFRGYAPFFESFLPSFWFLVFDYWQNLSNKGKGTYKHPRRKGIAGAPIIRESFRQSLTRYASPANAMLDRLNEYQMEQPAVLRWRIPTSSVSRTYEAILYPPDGKKKTCQDFFQPKKSFLGIDILPWSSGWNTHTCSDSDRSPKN